MQGSQYRIGEAYYRGDSEWPQDGEEALIWLSRAAKFANGDATLCAAAGVRTLDDWDTCEVFVQSPDVRKAFKFRPNLFLDL